MLEATNEREIEQAFMEGDRYHTEDLIDNTTPANIFSRRIVALADRYRIPAMHPYLYEPGMGGLISYGTVPRGFRYLATEYVVRILQGAKPSDLPVQQPTRFKLVINMKTGKALGLTIPAGILIQADEVIDE
jgi:putative ABC transport system substrate-binding protein